MADFNTPEEIARYMELIREQYEKGYITAKEYNDAMKDATVGIRGYTANLKNSMAQLGTSLKGLGKDIYSGKQGVGQFNNSIDASADAVSAYALKFGPAGVALGLFTQAVTKFVTASLRQSDLLFESYQKISRAGVVGSGAMTEVFDNMLKFGYTVDELGDLGDLLSRNSKNFGLFFQSALQGTRAFSSVANQIQNSALREQFFRLGLTVNDINDGIAGYISQQGKLGQIQGRSVDDLRRGSEAYIKELDLLTKLTGMTRQEQEEAREQALQIESFYAGLADLTPEAQEQALQAFTMAYAKGGPKAAAEMASSFNGVITGATDLLMTTGGASMQAFSKEFFARGGTAAQSFQLLKDSISPGMADLTKQLNQVGAGFGLNLRTINMLTKDGVDPLTQIMDQLTDEQFKQITGMDKATASQAKLRDNQIKTAQNLQDFVNIGVAPATRALQSLTSAVEYLTSFLPGRRRGGAAAGPANAPGTGGTAAEMLTGGAEAQLTPEERGAALGNLRIKSSEAYAGGETSASLIGVAQAIQNKLGPDLRYFSAFNDTYERGANSLHGQGRALDFTLNDPAKAQAVADMIRSIPGISNVINEYANPSKSATGGHIHAEISAANGAILSGPSSGYKPNLTMHGTEAIIPLNNPGAPGGLGNLSNQTEILSQQLSKLDELVSVMKNQVSISQKIMHYSS